MIRVGCCGFRGQRADYFRHFDVVEIQKTFYTLPMEKTVEKWSKEAPPSFAYTMKAWQLITHEPKSPTYRKAHLSIGRNDTRYGFFRPTEQVFDAWERCRAIARILHARIVVFQCPPSFHETREHMDNMEQFFSSIERECQYAWEPRGNWSDDAIERMCRKLDLIHCVDPFKGTSVYGAPKYYRLHGIGGYDYDYTDDDLRSLAQRCRNDEDTYVLFNNIQMVNSARRFRELLSSG